MRVLENREYGYFRVSVAAFVRETASRFSLTEEDAIERIERELRLLKKENER